MTENTARKFLEDYDPKIKENPSDAHLYTVDHVIERLDAFWNLKLNECKNGKRTKDSL